MQTQTNDPVIGSYALTAAAVYAHNVTVIQRRNGRIIREVKVALPGEVYALRESMRDMIPVLEKDINDKPETQELLDTLKKYDIQFQQTKSSCCGTRRVLYPRWEVTLFDEPT